MALSRFDRTAPEWLTVGGQIGEVVNNWARREDIVVFLGMKTEDTGAAACFNHQLSEMELDVEVAFGAGTDPAFVGDLRDRSVQFEYPVAVGAILHEAMHARHSLWPRAVYSDASVANAEERLVYKCLEEVRTEANGVRNFPENKSFLRASALHLVMDDMLTREEMLAQGHLHMAQLMILTAGRVEAGVLEDGDVKLVLEAAHEAYGEELVGKLRMLMLQAANAKADTDYAPLLSIAREYLELLREAGHDPAAGEDELSEAIKQLLQALGAPGESDAASEGEGESRDSGAPSGLLQALAEAIEDAARQEGLAQEMQELSEEAAAKARAEAKEKAEQEDVASEVFGRGTGPAGHQTRSRLVEVRPPKGPERAAAVSLSKDFERARYRDRVAIKRASAVPPGRLKMRSAMQGDIERLQGRMATATPWENTRRYHEEDPELKVGVMVDISGSMSRAMEPMASTAWVLSEAVRRVQGKAAMVMYGNDVFPTLSPGQHLDEVNVYSASDGTERFDKGFKALNGKMNLLNSRGARLLVVVSDLYHQAHEIEAARRWFDHCKRQGVAVLVVAPSKEMQKRMEGIFGHLIHAVTLDRHDVAGTARLIGAAAVKTLQAASQ